LLEQNAVEIDGDMVKEAESIINIPVGGLNLKVGKKKWFKVVP
jgi:hypothetical protein